MLLQEMTIFHMKVKKILSHDINGSMVVNGAEHRASNSEIKAYKSTGGKARNHEIYIR